MLTCVLEKSLIDSDAESSGSDLLNYIYSNIERWHILSCSRYKTLQILRFSDRMAQRQAV